MTTFNNFIDGEWVAGSSQSPNINPSNLIDVIGEFMQGDATHVVMTEKQVRLCVDDAARAEIRRGQCINQPLLAEHIALMALFLPADDSAMFTAQDFVVDGGRV
jgi:hypothetical protein